MNDRQWKNLALVFAGALASVIGGYYLPLFLQSATTPGSPIPWWHALALPAALGVILLALIVYGSGAGQTLCHRLRLWRRKQRTRRSFTIGILSDMGWNQPDAEIHAWTSIGPQDWKEEVERWAEESKLRIRVELIDVHKNFDSYHAVLNPYGGVYPERDLKTLETLAKILAYVSDGGLFVNVADIPCYYAYNALLQRRLDTTPPIYQTSGPLATPSYVPVRLFDRSPLVAALGLRIRGTGDDRPVEWDAEYAAKFEAEVRKPGRIRAQRFVVVERNVEPIIKATKTYVVVERNAEAIIKPVNLQYAGTPLFLVKYGDGSFLISLVWESYPGNSAMRQALGQILIAVLNNRWV